MVRIAIRLLNFQYESDQHRYFQSILAMFIYHHATTSSHIPANPSVHDTSLSSHSAYFNVKCILLCLILHGKLYIKFIHDSIPVLF